MRSIKTRLAFLTLALSCPIVVSSNSGGLLLDLSCQPRLSTELLLSTISDAISSNDHLNHVSIDLSFSELGDSGIEALVTSSLNLGRSDGCIDDSDESDHPYGAARVLKRLLGDELSDVNGTSSETTEQVRGQEFALRSLDLSWNNLHPGEPGAKTMMLDLRKLIEDPSRCPEILQLNRCSLGPAACRSIGKGIMNRGTVKSISKPLSLHLCGNPDVGDAGAAALAAAIRGSTSDSTIFSTLDLSACGIGDAGAEALALALEGHPGCIERLILSNNAISNSGASSIARGIADSKTQIEWLELDNNPGISNVGAVALADAIGMGYIRNLSLRSCEVKADGAKAFGDCLKALAIQQTSAQFSIDLSGNPLGMLKKKKKESLKNKATATTASYMNYIGKQIKSGLKDVGLDTMLGTSSVESDDDEEERMGEGNGNDSSDEPTRCGAKAFASAIVLSEEEQHRAGDALAATIVQAKERFGIDLEVDVALNHVLEDSMVRALNGSDRDGLEDMVDRHMETVEAIRVAEARASRASEAAAARGRSWDDSERNDYDGSYYPDDYDNEDDDDGHY
ncbi:hypothetical protein MHU86_11128 [Fragilaria crotonensis]|nr:hypothetical protein MHU86_11128 [Fragilaria crotonensis]